MAEINKIEINDIEYEITDITKMNKVNPTGTGYFSLNIKEDATPGKYSFTEGRNSEASGDYSHAEGDGTTASGQASHAEGDGTTASGDRSHAEGDGTTASGDYSHAEGRNTAASGPFSHAEGAGTVASGSASHAEGDNTTASGDHSHAEGYHTTASGEYQHVQGKYNIEDANNQYAHIVGNGKSSKASNAHTLDWNGTAWFAGDVFVGSTSGTNKDEGSKKLATEIYVTTELDKKANKSEGAFFIEGSGTTDSTAKTSTWVGSSDRITEYYDGLAIRYKIGVAGQSTVTLNINGLGAKTVYRFNTTKLTTHFPVGSIIHLIYHSDLNDGCWITNDYDANTNTYQRLYPTTTNKEYPITARYNTTTGSSYYAEYGRYSTGVTLNPSTKTITATAFKGKLTGNADTATKATQDASGNVITSTYATKTYVESLINEKLAEITNAEEVAF